MKKKINNLLLGLAIISLLVLATKAWFTESKTDTPEPSYSNEYDIDDSDDSDNNEDD